MTPLLYFHTHSLSITLRGGVDMPICRWGTSGPEDLTLEPDHLSTSHSSATAWLCALGQVTYPL